MLLLSVPFVAPSIWTATGNYGWAWTANITANFGAAAANRQIVVGVAANTAGQPNSVTIAGITATKILGVALGASLWLAAVPTGTSGTVSLRYPSSGNEDTVIQVGQILTSTPTPTSTASLANGGGGAGPFATTASLTVPTGGVGVAFTFTQNNGSATPITWSNGTVDYNAAPGPGPSSIKNQAAMVHYPIAGSVTPAFRVNDGSATGTSIVAAAWGP